jgi:hypothetical protein
LNVDLLFDISAAEKPLTEYFQHNHLNEETSDRATRSEKHGVSLKATPITVAQINTSQEEEVTRQTSCSALALMKCATVGYMKQRLDALRNRYRYLERKFRLPRPRDKPKKEDWARALAEHHREISSQDRDFIADIEQDVYQLEDFDDGFANKEKKHTELTHPFYALTSEAKEMFCDKFVIKVEFVDDNQDYGNNSSMDNGSDVGMADTTPRRVGGVSLANTPALLQRAMAKMQLFDNADQLE